METTSRVVRSTSLTALTTLYGEVESANEEVESLLDAVVAQGKRQGREITLETMLESCVVLSARIRAFGEVMRGG